MRHEHRRPAAHEPADRAHDVGLGGAVERRRSARRARAAARRAGTRERGPGAGARPRTGPPRARRAASRGRPGGPRSRPPGARRPARARRPRATRRGGRGGRCRRSSRRTGAGAADTHATRACQARRSRSRRSTPPTRTRPGPEPEQHVHERRLPAPARPGDREHLARRDGQAAAPRSAPSGMSVRVPPAERRRVEEVEDLRRGRRPFGTGVVALPSRRSGRYASGASTSTNSAVSKRHRAAHQAQADRHRHERHRDRRQQLEHERRQERHPERPERVLAVGAADGRDRLGLRLRPPEHLQRGQPGHHVQEVPAEPLQAADLRVHPLAGAGADERHEERDQRHRQDHDRGRDPVAREQEGHHHGGRDRRQRDLRQVAREVPVEGVDPARRQRRHRARVVRGRRARSPVRISAARSSDFTRAEHRPAATSPSQAIAARTSTTASSAANGDAGAVGAADQRGEQPRLRDERQHGRHAERDGHPHGPARGPRALQQPAIEPHAVTLGRAWHSRHRPMRVMPNAPRRLTMPSMTLEMPTELYGNAFLTERRARPSSAPDRDVRRRRHAPGGRGDGPRGDPLPQPRDVRDHLDGAAGAAARSPRTCTATSSTTPSTRRSAEIEQRCIRMLADLYHAPGETVGARTQGSSEAIMLGALSLKWKWNEPARGGRASRPIARTSSSAATCTWCGRSSAATSTSSRGSSRCSRASTRSAPRTCEPHLDENTIGVAAVLGTTFTGHMRRHRRHQRPARSAVKRRARPRRPAARRRRQRRLRVAVPLPRLPVGLPAGAASARSTSPATSTGWSTRASAG